MPNNWKYSFERLSKHKHKVICICGKKITLKRKWKDDYFDYHARHSGLQELPALETSNVNAKNFKKRYYCIGLRSAEISKYIQQTLAQFGGSRRVEVIACELFPNLFLQKFSRKRLNARQKRQLNCTLFTESVWKIDWASNAVHVKTCTGISENEMCVTFADKALKGVFKDVPVFTSLCEVIVILGGFSTRALDLFRQNLEGRTIHDNQISETIHHSHRLARDLAEYVSIIQPSNISIDINTLQIFIEPHKIDVSSSGFNKQSHDDNNEEYDLSSAINEASLEMKQITIETDDE
ncbi:2258_t:CDS:2 [Funneliformis geosporum]|nr:2258_t:CDS:2 [Funneliformis geosporum]